VQLFFASLLPSNIAGYWRRAVFAAKLHGKRPDAFRCRWSGVGQDARHVIERREPDASLSTE